MGTMDILLLKESSCCNQLAMFDNLKTGTHIFDEATETVRCTNFSLKVIGEEEPMGINIDGECCAITPIRVERQMGALRLMHIGPKVQFESAAEETLNVEVDAGP